ncbi:hypothetical protein GSI_02645 [Ganoderma sinense ZZ0214-1]|uniref:Uncharacterized protein n=1 Tax=Ganoderma sinense ZZ0214-1 TaxID=1077348 RepID=A0A2G8SMQ4_9APHY|nr:hypothetical protein GSI_02645 [Ganoderma sinense ZZ0214-1]
MQPLPHPIDRSRLTRYVTSSRVRCAQSGSYSSRLNSRNEEADYYPTYYHTLADLVNFEFDGAITVAQQFNLWLSKATFDLYEVGKYWFDEDDEGDHSEVEDMVQREEDDSLELDIMEVDEIDLEMADIQPLSSSPPPPKSGRLGLARKDIQPPRRTPAEFLVSDEARAALNPERVLTTKQIEHGIQNYLSRKQLAANPMPRKRTPRQRPSPRPEDGKAVFGWERRARCKIWHQCFPLIMEIKRGPSRSLRGEKFEVKMASSFELAAKDLYSYLQSYFARDVCAQRVIAVVASGVYWKWGQVERNEIAKATRADKNVPDRSLSNNEIELRSKFVSKLRAAPSFVLATEASDEELTRLRDDFLIPLIEEHYRYPSTIVPNLQPTKKDREGEEGGQGGHEEDEEGEDEDEYDEGGEDEDEYDEGGEDEDEYDEDGED